MRKRNYLDNILKSQLSKEYIPINVCVYMYTILYVYKIHYTDYYKDCYIVYDDGNVSPYVNLLYITCKILHTHLERPVCI